MVIIVIYQNKTFNLSKKDFQALNSKSFGFENNKSYFLNIYEVLFLLEKNKIKIIKNKLELNFNNILKKFKVDFNIYLIYKDLKLKGYIVKSGSKYGFCFRIYDKGIKIGEDHSLWLVEPVLDRQKLTFKDILGKNRIAHSTNKKLIFAILDSENSISYIENNWKRL